jgi:hypothetical protein
MRGDHAWPEAEFVQQAAAQKPWLYLRALIDKLETFDVRKAQVLDPL